MLTSYFVTLTELDHARSTGNHKPKPQTPWPKGAKVRLSPQFAHYLCDLVASADCSLLQLLRNHPELPHFKTIETWRHRYPWFSNLWNDARKQQAEFLIQKCLDLANSATPKTAHVARVQFDVYRFIAAKFSPDFYGDKPAQQQATINVGISISQDRLEELRAKLDQTRIAFTPTAKRLNDDSRTPEVNHANNHHENLR
jgi:hypothetical protein